MNNNIFKTLFHRFKSLPIELKNIVVCLLVLVIVINSYCFIRYMINTHTYNIQLIGGNNVSIYEGGEYIEDGYIAYDIRNKNVSKKVKISDNINPNKVGVYEVKYRINSIWKRNEIIRKVEVLENPIDTMKFELNGKSDLAIMLNGEYEEFGYKIESKYKDNFDKYVTIENDVKTTKIGEYQVKYTIKINNKQKELIRNVYVTGDRYTVIYDKKYTNKDLSVKILSNTNDFLYFDLGNKKIYDDVATLEIKDNGTYSLNMINRFRIDPIKFEINNIDREIPTGTCNSYMYKLDNKTSFEVKAEDNIGIAKYAVNDKEYKENNFTHNEYIEESSITLYDEAGNSNVIKCSNYYGPDLKNEKSKVIKEYYGDTIKYWVEKKDTYNITHIWVKDAYNQFKTGIKKPFPQLALATSIMNYVTKENNYIDKVMIGSNASGIVSDNFNTETAKLMPGWKYSSKSSVVMVDGQVIRNFTTIDIPKISAVTYGLKSNGYLDYYMINNYNDMTSNIVNYDKLIDDGVKYTFAFSPVLIHNGRVNPGLTYSNNIRQALGQKDLNNFIIITTTTTNRSKGLSYHNLAQLMKDLNCIEAFNLDGGGSTSLIYKDKDKEKSSSLVYSSRNIPDIIYFVGE